MSYEDNTSWLDQVMQEVYESGEIVVSEQEEVSMDEFVNKTVDQIQSDYFELEEYMNENDFSGEEKEAVLQDYVDQIESLVELIQSDDVLTSQEDLEQEIDQILLDMLSGVLGSGVFEVSHIDRRTKLGQMLIMSQYSNNVSRGLGWDSLKVTQPVGGYHIYNSDTQSLDETRDNTGQVISDNDFYIPPFRTLDFEGGWVRNIRLTEAEIDSYGFPSRFKDIMIIRDLYPSSFRHIGVTNKADNLSNTPDVVKDLFRKEWVIFPSQEKIGKMYAEVMNNSGERKAFLADYYDYAACIARICKDAGINVNFGPNIDLVPSVDDDQFAIAQEDRSYSSQGGALVDLAKTFIEGFSSVEGVGLVAKHYIGVGYVDKDLHRGIGEFQGSAGDMVKIENVFGRLQGNISGIMTSHIITPLDSSGRPVTISSKTIEHLRGEGYDGLIVSDDLNMEAMKQRYPEDEYEISYYDETGVLRKFSISAVVRRVVETVASGHDIVLYIDEIDHFDEIIDTLEFMIDNKVDLDGDGEPDITDEKVEASVERILNFKNQIGLVGMVNVGGRVYYYVPVESTDV